MKKIYTQGLASLVVTLAKKQTFKKAGFVAGLLLAFGMTAFSQTYYLRTDLTYKKGTKTYKYDVSNLIAWTTDPNGLAATSPADFTSPNQIFTVQTNGYSDSSALTISGAGSKLVVGTTDSAVSFNLGNNAAFTGTIDVAPFNTAGKSSTLYINQANTSTITLGTLGTGSIVRYGGNINGNVQQVLVANYYSLSLAVTTAATYATVTLPAATIGVAGVFTPRLGSMYGSTINFNGTGGQTIPAGTYYNLAISGTKTAPDSLKGAINIMGTYTDNGKDGSGNPLAAVSYVITNTKGVIAQAGSTLTFLGIKPQSVGNDQTLFNVSFSDGILLPVTAISGNTITLAQANPDLKIGQKINTNTFTTTITKGKPTGTAFANSILLDTTATITAISDTVVTLSSPLKLRLFVQHSSAGGAIDTLYATAFDPSTSTITLDAPLPSTYTDSSATVYGSNILLIKGGTGGSIIPATTYIATASGNTLTTTKPFVSINNLGTVAIGNPSEAPATKSIVGNLHLVGIGAFNSSVPVVTDGSTVLLEGNGNRIGGSTIWAYNNLTINQAGQGSTVVSAQAFINGTLSILSGKITSTSSSRGITLNENATYPAPATDSCYVSTPLAKVFTSTTPFTYYLGGSYKGAAQSRKVTLTPKTADTKTFSVGYYPSKVPNSAKLDSTTVATIDTVSNYNVVVYGHADGVDTTAQITFQFDPSLNPNDNYNGASLVLARYRRYDSTSMFTAETAPVTYATGTTPFSITTNGYDTAYGRYTFATAGPVLVPVKLSAVSATAQANRTIKINWSSANELNVSKYVIEGSVDGVNFSAKGNVAVKGSSNYSFVDATPIAGVNYYRIKAIDVDGKVNYSSIVSAKLVVSTSISITNPVKNKQLSVVLSSDAANYTVRVTNVLGKTVVAKTIAHVGGTATYNVSLPTSAAAGTYFVELSNGNSNTTKTIVVE